ncbi:MAG: L-threonylcarbamoyladenylate synthase [Planctomycetota bacterium]|nr:L-threonylcarbamoyladenylate synthase [Planctomycetota bacterium]
MRDTACGSDKDIERAAAILRDGGIVAFPTETVYGLGADAFNPRAVARVFEAKRRPLFDPLIVHVATTEMAGALAAEFPDAAWKLVESFWPGPLTLVLPKSARVPDIVTAGLPTVALRMPDHPIALAMIVAAGVPVAAPSANPFGRLSPTTADHVRVEIGSGADMVLDGGRCRVGIESSIVSLAGDRPVLLRCGGVPAEEIEKVTGPVEPAPDAPGRPQAPGMLARHYAPRTPLERRPPGMSSAPPGTRAGLLSFDLPAGRADGFAAVEILSPSGDLREAAANLFAALRRLDSLSLDVIFFDPVPERGLGAAINDRLAKASRPGDAATCDGGARPG